jgi:hypothetical protein
VNFVELLSDVMYSDSKDVVDALADFLESVLSARAVSEGRMTQACRILQVDASYFEAQITMERLESIETAEMEGIVEELVTAIGLQRFRFLDRQEQGESLERIGPVTRFKAEFAAPYTRFE